MDIWFYLFLALFVICVFLSIKIIVVKQSIKEIQKDLNFIIKSDTNSLITISTNDKDLKTLSKCLNDKLKLLRKLEIEYKQGNQELKTSITNISHDLRTPLTAIRGYIDLMERDNLTNKQKEYLKYIDEKSVDLTNLTEQLFYFSKGIEDYNRINKSKVCLNDILESVICSYYNLFKDKNIEPIIDITSKKIIKELDSNMIKRILENIIYNSIKYSLDMVKIVLKDNGNIEVSNKTTNFDSISVDKIFDRYYTVENAKKSNGIGLSIAKQLVELNNGKIKATYKNNILTIIVKF